MGSQGPPCYPTTGFPLSSMVLSIPVGYVLFVILGRFGITPWSPEMGPNTSLGSELDLDPDQDP